MPKKQERVIEFETRAWASWETMQAAAQRIRVQVEQAHVDNAYWRQFRDPISMALKDHLADDTCSDVIWNSDGWRPRWPDDDARIGVHMEVHDQQTGCFLYEATCYVPLPQRATRAMWKLWSTGKFEPFTMAIDLPVEMLRQTCEAGE